MRYATGRMAVHALCHGEDGSSCAMPRGGWQFMRYATGRMAVHALCHGEDGSSCAMPRGGWQFMRYATGRMAVHALCHGETELITSKGFDSTGVLQEEIIQQCQ